MPAPDLLTVARSWLDSRRERGCKSSTLAGYEYAARIIVLYFGPTAHLAAIRPEDCQRFKTHRVKCPHEANKEIRLARSIWKHAIQRGWAHSNPWLTCDPYPEGGHNRRKLTREEVAKLFAAIRVLEDTGRFRRGLGVCFRLVFYTGARIMEIRRLKWEHVDLQHPDGPRILLPEHKTSRHTGGRTLELCAAAAGLLQQLPRTSEWVFPPRSGRAPGYPWIQWQLLAKTAGVELPRGQATHSGRITFATTGLDAGVDIGSLMDALGHCDPRSTSRYAKYSSKAARRAVSEVTKAMFEEVAE